MQPRKLFREDGEPFKMIKHALQKPKTPENQPANEINFHS